MIKLNKQMESLEKAQDKIDKRIEELEAKKVAIEDKAADEDREMTKSELDRYFRFDEEISDLRCEYDEIQNAIDYISEYCD